MGEEPNPVAVADSGPLIHLYEIDRLPLLGVFSVVHLPQAVWDESVTSGRVHADALHVSASVGRHRVASSQVAQFANLPQITRLQQGELECLALCEALGVRLFLTDDLAAREAAKHMGIRPVGSLGVVVRAHHNRRLSLAEAEDAINRLCEVSSLFVTRAIADLAIELLRQTQ